MKACRVFLPVVLLVGAVAPVRSQPTSPIAPVPSTEVIKTDVFTVTGSHLKGIDTEKILPVTTLSAETIAASGVGSMGELVETLPFSTNVGINETAAMPNDARGDVSTINLRNLGASRTLVLLNGRRLSAHGVTPGTPPAQFVNVNAIPFGAIQQVEVLRDGASAIYGSDAIGGVVNTVLKSHYDRFDANARYAWGDAGPREFTLNLAGGRSFNADRSKLTLVFNYYQRDLLMAKDRDYAANADKRPLVAAPFNTNNGGFNRLSNASPFGQFTARNDAGASVSVAGVTNANGQFHYDPVTGAQTVGAGPTGFYNPQLGTQLLPEITRYNLLGTFSHRFSPAVSLFSEVSYYDSHSFGQIDASPISLNTDGVVVPRTNYYNPIGTRFYGPGTANPTGAPRDVAIRNYRLNEIGPRSYDTDSDSHRLLLGLRGEIPTTTWSWEAAAMRMRGRTYQANHGYISQSRLLQQLSLATPDAYNPFGGPGSNPANVWRNFVIDIWDDGVGTLTSFDGKASGQIFQLPGGAVSLAAGGEFRREAMKQRNDAFGLADDVIAQSEQLDVSASRDVYAAFAEVLVPLVRAENKIPFVQALELRLAGRFEEYSKFSATKPGAGLSWRPTSWLLVRASYNEGFRAPTIVELFTPAIGRRSEGFTDFARSGQSDAASAVSKRIVTGGNRNLRPEESKSYNVGFVVDIPWVKGLTFGADFFRIRQFDQIDNSDAANELTLDAQLWANGGGSNPRVLRAARTPADTAANIPGVLIEVLSTFQNLSLREVEGADLFANYRTPKFAIGRLDLTGALSYTDRLRTIDEKGNASEIIRANGNPRTKATFGVSWTLRDWSASVYQRFTSDFVGLSTGTASLTTQGQQFVIDEYWVTNASIGYAFRAGPLEGFRLRVGVNNVFDEPPPLYPSNSSGYNPNYHDPRGRMPYVDVSFRF